jgi:hypothetical protein
MFCFENEEQAGDLPFKHANEVMILGRGAEYYENEHSLTCLCTQHFH